MAASRVVVFNSEGVHSGDGRTVGAVAVSGGKVAAVGELSALRERWPDSEVIDLPGFVVPGFNDAHCHPALVAHQHGYTDASPRSRSSHLDILKGLASASNSMAPGRWVIATGYDPEKLGEAGRLTRDDLDNAVPGHPAVVMHMSAHWGVFNSAGVRAANIGEGDDDPPGGRYGRGSDGRLDGSVWERAFFERAYDAIGLQDTVLPVPGPDEMVAGLEAVQADYLASGFTSVTDALVGPTEMAAYRQMDEEGRLKMRVNLLATYESHEQMSPVPEAGMVRRGGVKIFIDGAVSGGSCSLSEPPPGHDGIRLMTDDDVADVVTELHGQGHQVAAHANGDEAIETFLRVLDGLGPDVPERRHRIEHCSLVDARLLAAMARLGVVAVPFGNYASFHGEKLLAWYGSEMAERMFAHRSMLDTGVRVAGSSDYPCGPFEIGLAFDSCVNRKSPAGPFGPSQAITPAEVLDIYTKGSAYASFEEDVKGLLRPGFLADFAVLDRDPVVSDPADLGSLKVMQTYLGGVRVA